MKQKITPNTSKSSTIRSRAPTLNDAKIEAIVHLLDEWNGVLTWELLSQRIDKVLGFLYTRQALDRHPRIKLAYLTVKETASETPRERPLSKSEREKRVDDYERLSKENKRLEAENSALLQQFVTWLFNAGQNGVTKEMLTKPLPIPVRGATSLLK